MAMAGGLTIKLDDRKEEQDLSPPGSEVIGPVEFHFGISSRQVPA